MASVGCRTGALVAETAVEWRRRAALSNLADLVDAGRVSPSDGGLRVRLLMCAVPGDASRTATIPRGWRDPARHGQAGHIDSGTGAAHIVWGYVQEWPRLDSRELSFLKRGKNLLFKSGLIRQIQHLRKTCITTKSNNNLILCPSDNIILR